ncbi:MAG: extracellular solute-binding protein [Eubacterium sp.]|nr:extracellular solute-binding protein [Eubacterium sp.]
MKIYKKVISVMLAAAMVLGVVGCGKKGKEDPSQMGGSAAAKQTSKECVYQEDSDFSISGIKGDITSFVFKDDTMYMLTSEWLESATDDDAELYEASEGEANIDDSSEDDTNIEESSEGDADSISESLTFRVYKASVDGGEAEEIYEKYVTDGTYIDSLMQKPDGTLTFNLSVYDDEGNYEKASLYEYDGKDFKETIDIKDIVYPEDGTYLSKMLFDKNGNLVAVYENAIRTYDSSKKKISEIKFDGVIDSAGYDKNGDILVEHVVYAENESGENSLTIEKIDTQKGEVVETYPLDVSYLPSSDSIMKGSGDYDFYYEVSSGIYGYKYSDKKGTQILEYSASDLDTNSLGYKVMVNDTFFCTMWDWESIDAISSVHKYVKVDPSEVEDRVILTIATLYGNYNLKDQVAAYNKSQNKVRIKIVDYGEENDPTAKMSADIAAGNLPDMYDLANGLGEMSNEQAIAKGLFEDLNPYIEKDADLSTDDLIPSVYNTLQHDGKLYYLASGFYVSTMMARASEVGEEPGWTFDEMKEYVDSKPDANLFYSNNKTDTITELMHGCIDDFVDWDKGECSFDSQEFINVLEMCNRGTNDEMEWTEDTPSSEEMLKDGSMLFLEGNITPEDLQLYNSMFDGDISFKGYPNKEKKGTYFSFDSVIAMSSKCEDKDAAWEFIRQYISEDFQGKYYVDMYAIPTREDVYEAYVQKCTCTEETKDKYGNDLYPINGTTGWDSDEVQLKPLTEEEMSEFRKLIDGAEGEWELNSSLGDIIKEEALAYFKGDKSAEDAAKIIQNRATTYVNENK